jgi:transcriptional regulator with XRE-family HTH domain
MHINETLGQKMQRLRTAAGLTQAQLAEAASVPLSSLQNWEIDRREPGFRAVVRLANALGVTAEVLADTVPVEEVGKAPRPAGPSKRPAGPSRRASAGDGGKAKKGKAKK